MAENVDNNAVQDGESQVPVVAETVAVAPVELPELRYVYQPKDEEGRPLGAKQVIKYKTSEELADKLAEQNTLLVRKLRSVTRQNRLGTAEADEIPAESAKFAEPISFKPVTLTDEQRIQISRDLLDPEKFDEASDALVTAKFGVQPEKIIKTLAEVQGTNIRILAKIESDAFVADNPDYVKCNGNFEAITSWMVRYDLAPTRENFQLAYDTLKKSGVLVVSYTDVPEDERPVQAVPVVPVQAVPVVEPVVQAAPVPAPVVEQTPDLTPGTAHIPTGFNRENSDSSAPIKPSDDEVVYEVFVRGEKKLYKGLAAINAMPSEVYRRWIMSDPKNVALEARLEQEAESRRRARAQAQ